MAHRTLTLVPCLVFVLALTQGCSFTMEQPPPRSQWDADAYVTCDTSEARPVLDGIGGGTLLGLSIGAVAAGYPLPLIDLAVGGVLTGAMIHGSEVAENCREYNQYRLMRSQDE